MSKTKYSQEEVQELANKIAESVYAVLAKRSELQTNDSPSYVCGGGVTTKFKCGKVYNCVAPHRCKNSYSKPSGVSVLPIVKCETTDYNCDATSFHCKSGTFDCGLNTFD